MWGASVFRYPGEKNEITWVLVGRRSVKYCVERLKRCIYGEIDSQSGVFIFSVKASKCTGENPAALPESFIGLG